MTEIELLKVDKVIFRISFKDHNLHILDLTGSLYYGNYELRKV